MAVRGLRREPGQSPLMAPDQEEFEAPNVVPGSSADHQLSEQSVDESLSEDLAEAEEEQPVEEVPQEELPLEGGKPSEPAVVQNNKMLCQFVRPHFERDKDGERFVGFEFSIPLFPVHEEKSMLPTEVLDEWTHMRKGNASLIRCTSVAQQTIAVGQVPDDPDNDFFLVAATISHAVLQVVEVKGSGKTTRSIRFSFRATVDQTEECAKFAVDNHGNAVWLNMQRTNASLFDKPPV